MHLFTAYGGGGGGGGGRGGQILNLQLTIILLKDFAYLRCSRYFVCNCFQTLHDSYRNVFWSLLYERFVTLTLVIRICLSPESYCTWCLRLSGLCISYNISFIFNIGYLVI